jgi:hypothetical protein
MLTFVATILGEWQSEVHSMGKTVHFRVVFEGEQKIGLSGMQLAQYLDAMNHWLPHQTLWRVFSGDGSCCLRCAVCRV